MPSETQWLQLFSDHCDPGCEYLQHQILYTKAYELRWDTGKSLQQAVANLPQHKSSLGGVQAVLEKLDVMSF